MIGDAWKEMSEVMHCKVSYSEVQIREQVGETHQPVLMVINRDNEDITSSPASPGET